MAVRDIKHLVSDGNAVLGLRSTLGIFIYSFNCLLPEISQNVKERQTLILEMNK